ncbi:hypothetical protein [Croceibacterium ferulae]|uniref:hypothetical protein n=1 Tax=Croceibacterium ferulae TaxID=1854641 RepID=UPI000EB52EC6|nr:hypothetical protein [Croceibacterium ferulae]
MKLRTPCCLIAASIGFAVPAGAQVSGLEVAPLAEIVAGVQSCRKATNASGVNPSALAADGWSAVTATQGGQPTEMPVPILSKGSVLLMYADESTAACFIVARLDRPRTALRLAADLDRELAVDRKQKGDGTFPVYWFPEGHLVQLETTGTQRQPAVRISVGGHSGSGPS